MTAEELEARKEEFARLRRERERLKEVYLPVHRWVRDVFARHDPLGLIAVGAPSDEYEEQADLLLPCLLELHQSDEVSEAEILRRVHQVFGKWFGAGTAGPAERYASSAAEIYAEWGRRFAAVEVDAAPVSQVD